MQVPLTMPSVAATILEQWLVNRLSSDNWQWLRSRLSILNQPHSPRELHIALGLVPRKLGRTDLALTDEENEAALRCCNLPLNATGWTVETAARILILCTVANQNESAFGPLFSDLCKSADLNESITFYRGLVLYPPSEALDQQIGEGLRTNIRAVFESIAHHNAYPSEYFDQNRWNHMVLKALFIDSTLDPIIGLDARANPELASILCDYAHERWAAGRRVSPELWRCVAPFASGNMIDDLVKAARSGVPEERLAGLLALSQCPDNKAREVLNQYTGESATIARGEISWSTLNDSLGIVNARESV